MGAGPAAATPPPDQVMQTESVAQDSHPPPLASASRMCDRVAPTSGHQVCWAGERPGTPAGASLPQHEGLGHMSFWPVLAQHPAQGQRWVWKMTSATLSSRRLTTIQENSNSAM